MKNKLWSVLGCACVVSTALVGCGGNKDADAGGNTAPANGTTMEAPAGDKGATTPAAPQKDAKAQDDAQFAQASFKLLAEGEPDAQNVMDWESLTGMGQDVGKMYTGLKNDEEKAAFRKAFVDSFSKSFKKTGANGDSFKNWRIKKEEGDKTTVIADGARPDAFEVVISHPGGEQKIASMNPTKK